MSAPFYEVLGWSKEHFRNDLSSKLDDDWSIPRLSKYYEISNAAVYNWMKKFDLSRRKKLRNSEWLKEQYVDLSRSSIDIANELGVSDAAVRWHLHRRGIPVRDLFLAQRIAQPKRQKTPLHEYGSTRSSGYIFWYQHHLFRSVAEYLWFVDLSSSYKTVVFEPFVYKNKRPDFLVDSSTVIEIKDSLANFKKGVEYDKLAEGIKRDLGYEYQMIFVRDLIPDRYSQVLGVARDMGATPGIVFSLIHKI